MSNVLAEWLLILLLIVLNGFLAMSEIAIVAARRARLEHRPSAAPDPHRGRVAGRPGHRHAAVTSG